MTINSSIDATIPKQGQFIFWRYKGDKPWNRGYVRMVNGRMFEVSTPISDTILRVDDVDWEPND